MSEDEQERQKREREQRIHDAMAGFYERGRRKQERRQKWQRRKSKRSGQQSFFRGPK